MLDLDGTLIHSITQETAIKNGIDTKNFDFEIPIKSNQSGKISNWFI